MSQCYDSTKKLQPQGTGGSIARVTPSHFKSRPNRELPYRRLGLWIRVRVSAIHGDEHNDVGHPLQQPPRSCTYVRGFLRFARKFNSDFHVWRLPLCRSAQHDGCAAQTNPTPDLTLTLTLTLTLAQPFGGLEVCSRGRQGQC